jgi:transcriptional regulator with XRE-family HTH domain
MQGMTGKELEAIRIHHKLTRPQLGSLLGYNANYIYRLERKDLPITQRLEKLVVAMLGKQKTKKSS